MKNKEPLLITLNNYPESCNLCRIGLITDYTDLYKWKVLDHFFVGYVEAGSLRWEFKNNTVNMGKGDIFICYPGVISRGKPLEPDTQIYSIEFTKEFLNYHEDGDSIKDRFLRFMQMDMALGEDAYQLFKIPLLPEDMSYVIKEIKRFYYEFYQRREGMFDVLYAHLLIIVNLIGRKFLYQNEIVQIEKMYSVMNQLHMESIEYLQKHFCERITLDDIVTRFATSKTAYCTWFKNTYNTTFYSYLNDLRLEKAVHMLLETDITAEEIAGLCGFGDMTGMFRCFKKRYGISPGKYRKEYREISAKH